MRALILLLLLVGCDKNEYFVTAICSKNSDTCVIGNYLFPSRPDCEEFLRIAKEAQPNAIRTCIKAQRIYE